MSRLEKEIVIANTFGLHGRPSALIAETAKSFTSDIRLVHQGEMVDCKSVLDVMSLACSMGSTVTLVASGEDADEALLCLASLVAGKFGEE